MIAVADEEPGIDQALGLHLSDRRSQNLGQQQIGAFRAGVNLVEAPGVTKDKKSAQGLA